MDLSTRLESFHREGYVIFERLLDTAAVEELEAALATLERETPMGRNNFEGERTQRIYSLAGKGDVFMRLAENPTVVAMLDALMLPNWLLSNLQSIRIHPGETPQPWHADDTFYPIPRPRQLLSVSTIWALDDFTEENGATEILPRSHLWGNEVPEDDDPRRIFATMPAGSVIVFHGALWHRGGKNRSHASRLAVSPQYCQSWLRPQESQLLIAPPDVAARYSERGRSMLGYNIHPPFVGQVEGMHPLRLIDPSYRQHKTNARAIADEVLERPKAVL